MLFAKSGLWPPDSQRQREYFERRYRYMSRHIFVLAAVFALCGITWTVQTDAGIAMLLAVALALAMMTLSAFEFDAWVRHAAAFLGFVIVLGIAAFSSSHHAAIPLASSLLVVFFGFHFLISFILTALAEAFALRSASAYTWVYNACCLMGSFVVAHGINANLLDAFASEERVHVPTFLEGVVTDLSHIVSSVTVDPAAIASDPRNFSNVIEMQHSFSELLRSRLDNILHVTAHFNGFVARIPPKMDTFNVSELVNRCIRVIQLTNEHADVSFSVVIDPLVPEYVVSEARWVHCCILTFAEEALHRTGTGEVTVSVHNNLPGTLTVTVTDPGSTCDDAPFTERILNVSRLGLLSVKSRMDVLGGSYGHQVLPDGNAFWISFPVLIPDTPEFGNKDWTLYNDLTTTVLCADVVRAQAVRQCLGRLGLPTFIATSQNDIPSNSRVVCYESLQFQVSVDEHRCIVVAFGREQTQPAPKYHSDPELGARLDDELRLLRKSDSVRSEDDDDHDGDDTLGFCEELALVKLVNSRIAASRVFTVLVVDDSRVIQKSLRRMISRHGFEVDLASNGKEGLERLKTKKYVSCFCDVVMPVMSGTDMIKELDASKVPRPYFVIVTAQLYGSHTLEPLCDSLIFKPFSTDDVAVELKNAVKFTFEKALL